MKLARLHRRLSLGMGGAALLAYGAGAGFATPLVVGGGGVLALGWAWQPGGVAAGLLDRFFRLLALAVFAWTGYVALRGGDFLPPMLLLVLVLLAGEALRPLDARNDMRLYSLSLALLIAATAFYPGVLFAAAFAVYVACGTLALMTGHLRREAERFGVREVPLGRRYLAATALLSGFTILASAAVFLLFPRLPRGWSLHGRSGGEVMAGFSNEVSLAAYGSRITANDRVAFRVEFPSGVPPTPEALHWRGRSYDHFDGVHWERTAGVGRAPPAGWYRVRWGPRQVLQTVYGGPPGAQVLFGLHPVQRVDPRSAIRAFTDRTGDVRYAGADAPVYDVVSLAGRPPLDALGDAGSPALPPPSDAYLQLPPLEARVERLAERLVQGSPTRLARVEAVEAWLQNNFRYTLDLPSSPLEASIEAFLFRRQAGHCEYFSTAMVVLLRSVGIPARNVNGFLGGEWNPYGGYLLVRQGQAHSWVEVWFPGAGWVAFDPTPPAERAAALSAAGTGSFAWVGGAWLDGLQHRWYKWVLDYDLGKQLAVFGSVRDAFAGAAPARFQPPDLRHVLLPAGVAAAVALLLWFVASRARAPRLRPESRRYLRLRRAYARAGYATPPSLPPLAWAERLRGSGAPGAQPASRAVAIYLRDRWSGEQADRYAEDDGLEQAIEQARRELRAGRRL
ncbi:MAG: transglutaminaseTgpA domain-containing protein, partial [Longimicrobiaceae bacterium]